VKFGLSLVGLRPRWYAAVARQAEDNGFESVWLAEHLVLPAIMPATYLYSANGQPPITPETPVYDPWVMLAGVAAVTTRIRLGTNVYVLPLRHPLVTARAVVSLDRLSGGRVTLGAGVGWLATEYAAAGVDFTTRGRRMDEIIPLLRRLWSSTGPVAHQGRYYAFEPVRFAPRALQKPGIPIELGGTTGPALRRAGRLGDGWIELGSATLPELAARIDEVRAARATAGLAAAPFEISSGFGADLESVRETAAVGVTRTITAVPPAVAAGDLDDVLDWVRHYAATVVAPLADVDGVASWRT
jgi:probable F420-dependent oxidoreductase